MASVDQQRASEDHLLRTRFKAEMIHGRIVPLMATGRRPNRVAGRIYMSLLAYETGGGQAFTDNMGFLVPMLRSGRESFSPNVSFSYAGHVGEPMRLIRFAPEFAVEVRGEADYGMDAEQARTAKRVDYFEAGTMIVWDVDPEAELIRSSRHEQDGGGMITFVRGQIAHAEQAVPGWRIAVDEVFA